MAIDFIPATNGGITTFFVCLAIILSGSVHGPLTFDDRVGPQKLHVYPTPRIGGAALLIGLLAAFAYSSVPVRELLKPIVIASLPAFLFGFAEDLSRRVRWQERLAATICSGFLIWWLTGISIDRTDIFLLDWTLTTLPLISIIFTAFAVGGMCNAFNMVDGVHGLAGGLGLIALASLGSIATAQADYTLAQLCFVQAFIVFGFLLVNFPFGKLFLGDGGAYLIGFLVGWSSVLLVARNPSVSPWAPILICAYPILEVGYSVIRRRARAHVPAHPDGLHLHSLLNSRVTKKILGNLHPNWQNALVSPIIWFFAGLSAFGGFVFQKNTPVLVILFISFLILYVLIYLVLIGFARRLVRQKAN